MGVTILFCLYNLMGQMYLCCNLDFLYLLNSKMKIFSTVKSLILELHTGVVWGLAAAAALAPALSWGQEEQRGKEVWRLLLSPS